MANELIVKNGLKVDSGIVSYGCNNSLSAGTYQVSFGANNTITGTQSYVFGACNTGSGNYTSITGGFKNLGQAQYGHIGSGICNNICNNTSGCLALGSAIVSGVGNNTTGGTWDLATCAFTVAPTICNAGRYSFIGSGFQNHALGDFSAIAGGCRNCSQGLYSFVGGGICNNARHATSACCAIGNTIAGGIGNGTTGGTWSLANCCFSVAPTVCNMGYYSTIGGGFQNRIQSSCATLSGGYKNIIWPNGSSATISGGAYNQVCCSSSVVAGGIANTVVSDSSSILGGVSNQTYGNYSTIGGGIGNCNCGEMSFIGNGFYNLISSNFWNGFIGAGCCNTVDGKVSSVVGGWCNYVNAVGGFIGGGLTNFAYNNIDANASRGAVVAGGIGNNTCGGTFDSATCVFSVAPTVCNTGCLTVIGGGFQNVTSGDFSAVLGGCCNVASGAFSGAFGCGITASAACTFYTNNFCACGNVSVADAKDVLVGTTTGTKIGTTTTQKIGFWNAAPIVQPTTAVTGATRVGGGGTTVTDTDTFDGYTIGQVVKALRNTGLLA